MKVPATAFEAYAERAGLDREEIAALEPTKEVSNLDKLVAFAGWYAAEKQRPQAVNGAVAYRNGKEIVALCDTFETAQGLVSKKSKVQTIASLGTTLALAGCSIIPVERRVTEKEVMFAKQSTVSKLEEQIREPTFAEPPVQATSKYLPEAEKYAGIAQTSFTLYSNEKGAELVKTSVDTRGILNPYVPLFSQIESTLIASSTKRLTLTDNSIAQTISPRNVSYNFASSGLSRVEFSTTC